MLLSTEPFSEANPESKLESKLESTVISTLLRTASFRGAAFRYGEVGIRQPDRQPTSGVSVIQCKDMEGTKHVPWQV